MILTAVFKMMSTGEVWNPTDLFKVDMSETFKERQLAKAVKQATKYLEKQGCSFLSYLIDFLSSSLQKRSRLARSFSYVLHRLGVVILLRYSTPLIVPRSL